jgi:hypothetical protein
MVKMNEENDEIASEGKRDLNGIFQKYLSMALQKSR